MTISKNTLYYTEALNYLNRFWKEIFNLEKRHLYRSLKMLEETEMLRLIQAAQFCTEGEYVDYNPPKVENKKSISFN